jgi:hypothetical protein
MYTTTQDRTSDGFRAETRKDRPGAIAEKTPIQGTARSGTSKAATTFFFLLLFGPLSCILLNPALSVVCRLTTGTWPIGGRGDLIHEGMTATEVKSLLGEPHERQAGPYSGETWIYWTDGLGIGFLRVHLDDQGVVTALSI